MKEKGNLCLTRILLEPGRNGDQVAQMIRRAFKTLPEVPVRTFKCISFREVPEVYHRFMDILHCFISPKVSVPIRGVSLEQVYLVLQLQSSPYQVAKIVD